MITGVIDGHVTRLATPPDPRHILNYHNSHEDIPRYQPRYYQHPRPPPAPRPKTMEGCDIKVRRATCSPFREGSLDPGPRGSSCDRYGPYCYWEEEQYEDPCDERHHHHRHSYHEGLHHAHETPPQRWGSRERRQSSGRRSASPCCWQPQWQGPGSPPNQIVEQKVGHQGSERPSDSEYIPLWRCHSPRALEERLARLENDKETLTMQVSVLSDQVEAQQDKIRDLEAILDEKKRRILHTEEMLQKEIIAKTSLETQRLELLSEISNMKLRQAACEKETSDLREKLKLREDSSRSQQMFHPTASSTPLSSFHSENVDLNQSSPSSPMTGSLTSPDLMYRSLQRPARQKHESPRSPRTPPSTIRRKIDHLGTIPRSHRDHSHNGFVEQSATMGRPSKGVAFAETEKTNENGDPRGPEVKRTASVAPSDSPVQPALTHKPSGLRKIFTRLRRSSSGHLENDGHDQDFKRGGIRATAAARLGWTGPSSAFKRPDRPFTSWSVHDVEQWLCSLGLSQYCAATRCWMDSGEHISKATPANLEKDLGVRHPLHRKKLQLSISQLVSPSTVLTLPKNLDVLWVLRWLDDVGLPQYKDAFSESRVDGLLLNYLTIDDLSFLRVSNLLHVTSLKRGIQALRQYQFDSEVLVRRSAPGEEKKAPLPQQVAVWSNHRVMEWLKTVDLSEYAPNLRGSGVHGALLVYESRFTSELLASILSISSSRTLLRRHLTTHFNELLGKQIVQMKRETEIAPSAVPLTISAKIKLPKKSQFSLKRRKTKSDYDFDDLLCPLDDKPPKIHAISKETTESD